MAANAVGYSLLSRVEAIIKLLGNLTIPKTNSPKIAPMEANYPAIMHAQASLRGCGGTEQPQQATCCSNALWGSNEYSGK